MELILDTPHQKKWWLPDGRHQFNIFDDGHFLNISIWDNHHKLTRLEFRIIKDQEDTEYLLGIAKMKARRMCPKPSVVHNKHVAQGSRRR